MRVKRPSTPSTRDAFVAEGGAESCVTMRVLIQCNTHTLQNNIRLRIFECKSVMGQNPGIDTKLRYFSEKKFRAFEFFHCARGVLRLVSGVRKDP